MTKERENFYIELIKTSSSLIEVCRKAGIVPTTGNYDTLKNIIKKNDVDISHFKRISGIIQNKNCSIEDFLTNKVYITSFKLKNKLFKYGLKERKCECCGNVEWQGKPIPLELHHVNGDNKDNRLENLQILCPNCHAFTDTYGGKNQKLNIKKEACKEKKKVAKKVVIKNNKQKPVKVKKETYDINNIVKRLLETKNFTKVGKEYNVSDNAIRKRLKKHGYSTNILMLEKEYRVCSANGL